MSDEFATSPPLCDDPGRARWLRLPDFDVSNPRLMRGEHDEVVEVQVDCVPNKFDVDLWCLARKLVTADDHDPAAEEIHLHLL